MTISRKTLALLAPLALAVAAAMTACGGGTSQVESFKPERLLVFGDELNLMASDGSKYSVNSVTDAGALTCETLPLWTQSLATYYGMAFAQCNPSKLTETRAKSLATVDATVADFITQADSYDNSTGFTSADLVTVVVGLHDVINAYGQFPTRTEAELTALLKERGEAMAVRINAMTGKGARVLVSTALDVSLSPWALAEKAAHTDTDRAALLSRLVTAFNLAMRLKLVNDGSKIGLLLGDDLSRSMTVQPGYYGMANATVAACKVALPGCTSKTLIDGATVSTYLWADGTRPGSPYHYYLGEQAKGRVATLPF